MSVRAILWEKKKMYFLTQQGQQNSTIEHTCTMEIKHTKQLYAKYLDRSDSESYF